MHYVFQRPENLVSTTLPLYDVHHYKNGAAGGAFAVPNAVRPSLPKLDYRDLPSPPAQLADAKRRPA